MITFDKESYSLKKDDKIIGHGNEKLEIFIEPNYRGQGYGKLLFEKILEELKQKGNDDITISFDKKNVQMRKIVTDFKGIELSLDEDKITYFIPLK